MVKTEQEAKELQARIAKGEDFADLAKKYSLDPSAKANGRRHRLSSEGHADPGIRAGRLQLTKVGQVSHPVKTQLGYHIIKLEGVKAPAYVPFPEVKDFIRQKMLQEKQTEMVQKYIEDLKKNAKIVINEEFFKEEAKQGEAPAKAGSRAASRKRLLLRSAGTRRKPRRPVDGAK